MKKSCKKLLKSDYSSFWVVIFALFFLSACVADLIENLKPNQSAVPNWYNEPPPDSEGYWIGVGKASTTQQAEKQALLAIAGRVNTTIKSRYKQQTRAFQDQTQESAYLDFEMTTDEVTFRDFVVEQRVKANNQYYVQVRVNKEKFLNNLQNSLALLNQELDHLVSDLARDSIVVRLKALQTITKKREQAEKLARLLNAFNKLPEDMPFYYYAEIKHKESEIRSSVKFHIQYDNDMRFIAEHLKEQLNKENFRVATTVSRYDPNVVYVLIEGKSKNNEIYGTFMSKLSVTLKVQSKDQHLISSKQLVPLSGSSETSFEFAIKAASNQFAEYVNKNCVFLILGLSETCQSVQ